MGICLLHFFKQHLTAFVDKVYWRDLEKKDLASWYFFIEIYLSCRMSTFRGQKVVKHSGHQGILFLIID